MLQGGMGIDHGAYKQAQPAAVFLMHRLWYAPGQGAEADTVQGL